MQSGDENLNLNSVEDPAGRGTFEPVNGYDIQEKMTALSDKDRKILTIHWKTINHRPEQPASP